MIESKKNMAEQAKTQKEPAAPLNTWLPAVAIAWLVPGGGHFYLGKRGRGLLLLFSVLSMFVLGLTSRGAFFQPQTGDLLTTLIYCGGFLGDVLSGFPYFLAVWMGYAQPAMPGMMHDYGTKFLVSAGLLNVLAMVDAFEIAVGRKD